MSAYDGKTCAVSFAIAPETAAVPTVWTTLGMMRTKSISGTWDTADSTADSTPNSAKTAIATRKSFSFSGDGVSYDDAAYNQRTLKSQFFNPGSTTQNQPKAWFKLAYASGESFIGPFMMTSWKDDSPEADVQTWSIEAASNGNVVYAAS
jgi:predicted secreted protein